MMWNCPLCGCQEIAGSLDVCPHCHTQAPAAPPEAETLGATTTSSVEEESQAKDELGIDYA
jgi:hypothetical protein